MPYHVFFAPPLFDHVFFHASVLPCGADYEAFRVIGLQNLSSLCIKLTMCCAPYLNRPAHYGKMQCPISYFGHIISCYWPRWDGNYGEILRFSAWYGRFWILLLVVSLLLELSKRTWTLVMRFEQWFWRCIVLWCLYFHLWGSSLFVRQVKPFVSFLVRFEWHDCQRSSSCREWLKPAY